MKLTKLLALVLAAVLVLSFAACGNVPTGDEDGSTNDDFTVTEPEETADPEAEESTTEDADDVTPPTGDGEKEPVETLPATETLFDPELELDLTGPFSVTYEMDVSSLYSYPQSYDEFDGEYIEPTYTYEVENMSMDMTISYLAPKQFSVTMENDGMTIALICVNDVVYMDMMGEKAGINISDESITALRDVLNEMLTDTEEAPAKAAEIAPIVNAAFDFVVSLLDGKVTGADMNNLYAAIAPFVEDMSAEAMESMDEGTKAFMDATEALATKLVNGQAVTEAEIDAYAEEVAKFLNANGATVTADTVGMAFDLVAKAAEGATGVATLTEDTIRLIAAVAGDLNGAEIAEADINRVVDAVMTFAEDLQEMFADVAITDLIGISESTEDGNTVVTVTGLTDLAFEKISAFLDLADAVADEIYNGELDFITPDKKADILDALEVMDEDHLSMVCVVGADTIGATYTTVVDADILDDPDLEETFTLVNAFMMTITTEGVTVEAPADAGSYTVVSLTDLLESASRPSAPPSPEYDEMM